MKKTKLCTALEVVRQALLPNLAILAEPNDLDAQHLLLLDGLLSALAEHRSALLITDTGEDYVTISAVTTDDAEPFLEMMQRNIRVLARAQETLSTPPTASKH